MRSPRISIRALFSYRAVVLAAAMAAAITALMLGVGGAFEHNLRTMRDMVRSHPASGEIVIVEIDAQSLAEIDRWPWPRGVHGELVERLDAANADIIAFDVDFSAHSTEVEDVAFGAALAESDALVLLPAFRQYAGSGSTNFIDSEPIDELRDSAFLASVNIQPGENGQVRRALMGVHTNGLPRPSLAAMLSDTHGAADNDFPIDFAIDPNSIPRISYADIVADRADLSLVDGKTVLIGATAIEMGDRYAVPGHGVIPGVVIQALAAETLIAGGVPSEYGPWAALAIALIGVLLLISTGTLWVRGAAFGISGALVLILPILTEARLHASFVIMPALAMMFAAAFASVIVLALRKYRRTMLRDRETGLPNRTALLASAFGAKKVRVIVARIGGFSQFAALFSAEELGEYFQEVDRRMRLAIGEGSIYRIDDALIAWRADALDGEEIADHIDAIAAIFRSPVQLASQRVDTDLSFGVAEGVASAMRDLTTGAAHAADDAEATGCRWVLHVEGDNAGGKWQLSLLGELDDAMADGSLWVAFQPKLDISTRRIESAEALVRWQHPVRGTIPPDSFIPLVEKRGRMVDLTLFVTDRAIEAVERWYAVGLDVGAAINVSATLLGDQAFLDALARRVAKISFPAEMLTIEITESAALENPETAITAMESLRQIGMRLSVDDYGTGQSTLTYLKRLPAQEIKIDKSFVQAIDSNDSDRILVRSTIDLAHELNLKVVAEGIETEECLTMLAELGCDTGQGYHIGKPMPADELEGLLTKDVAIQPAIAA